MEALGKLPSDASRLEALYDIDQKSLGICPEDSDLSDAQFIELNRACDAAISEINLASLAWVQRMTPAAGWFSNRAYGQKAATGAYLVVQHTNNPPLQKSVLPKLEALIAKGEAMPSEYAMIYDRAAVHEGRLQRYGTQMRCEAGKMVPEPMEDPAGVDDRRRPMNFRWATYADYTAQFGACPRKLRLMPD